MHLYCVQQPITLHLSVCYYYTIRILKTCAQELQHRFDSELPESVRQQSEYARNFLEFCSFETLDVMTRDPDYLSDKEFRRLMFDMMLAWEIPGSESEKLDKARQNITCLFFSVKFINSGIV